MEIKCNFVELVEPKILKPYSKNRNQHSENQIDMLCELLEHHGFRSPLIVSRLSGQVVAGNGRLMAAIKMGLKEVPVSYQDFENEDAEYTFSVSDNAISAWSELDLGSIKLDALELGSDFDIKLLGIKDFDTNEIEIKEVEIKEKEIDENLPTDKECPSCGYKW